MADYHAALARGCIAVAQCASCGRQQAIPAETCFNCGSEQLTARDHNGAGRVFSWVVNHYAFAEGLAAEMPYTIVLVALDGGGRVYGRLASVSGTSIEASMPLELDGAATRASGYPIYQSAA